METIVIILQFLIFIGAVSVFFIGIFKPSFLLKRKFTGRRFVLILFSFVILAFIGILENYKIEHIYTNEEREQYYAERRKQAIQDSIKKVEKQREKFVRDSLKTAKKQQKELQYSTKDNENQEEKLEDDKSQTTKENKIEQEDITYSQYSGVVSNIKYKNKGIVGIGLDALKKKNSRYEIVTFTFKNNTNQTYMLSSEDFRLYDGENYYSVSIDAQIEAELTTNILGAYTLLDIMDEINPQVTRKYKLIFEVPKKGDYKLVCTDDDIFIKHQ